jgi:hypothetical protein
MAKYLVYSSDTKLSMLEPQVSRTLWERVLSKFKPEIGFETLGFKANLSVDGLDVSAESGRIDKVVRDLRSKGKIGTIGSPKAWFSGSVRMKWDVFSDYAAKLVLFIGLSETTIVCLVGSIESLIGWEKSAGTNHSIDYYMLRLMNEIASSEQLHQTSERSLNIFMQAVDRIHLHVAEIKKPAQEVEFVARKIAIYPAHSRSQYYLHERPVTEPQPGDHWFSNEEINSIRTDAQLLIGSPLYVALQD